MENVVNYLMSESISAISSSAEEEIVSTLNLSDSTILIIIGVIVVLSLFAYLIKTEIGNAIIMIIFAILNFFIFVGLIAYKKNEVQINQVQSEIGYVENNDNTDDEINYSTDDENETTDSINNIFDPENYVFIIGAICALWHLFRLAPCCHEEWEYQGTYLILGTLIDEYVDSNAGIRVAVSVGSIITGIICGFIAYYAFTNGLFWIIYLLPVIQILKCVIGLIKAFSDY